MEIGGGGILPGGHRKVEHPLVLAFLLHDELVGGSGRKRLTGLTGRREMLLVQVALVHGPHVGQEKHAHQGDGHINPDLLKLEQIDGSGSCQDEKQGTQGIGTKQGTAVGLQGFGQLGLVLGVMGGYEIAGQVGEQGKEQGDSPGNTQGPFHGPEQFFLLHFPEEQLVQGKQGQQGHGQGRYDQGHAHGPELIVAGHMVHEEVGQGHEVMSPRQEDAQDGGSQQPPFNPLVPDEHPQDEQEDHDGPDIDITHG